jgi:hypothetical protein
VYYGLNRKTGREEIQHSMTVKLIAKNGKIYVEGLGGQQITQETKEHTKSWKNYTKVTFHRKKNGKKKKYGTKLYQTENGEWVDLDEKLREALWNFYFDANNTRVEY